MSALLDFYIKKETLQTLLDTVSKKQEKGVSLTVSVSNETKVFEFGDREVLQNVSSYVSQSKEQRENKEKKFYVGNGKVFWNDGSIKNAEKPNTPKEESNNDLPF